MILLSRTSFIEMEPETLYASSIDQEHGNVTGIYIFLFNFDQRPPHQG